MNTHGKIFPSRPGEILSPREHERIAAGLHLVSKGAYCSINPIRQNIQGKAPSDADITAYRYTLIEADELSQKEQWTQMRLLHIPVAMAIWSGGKSIHLIVRINADDKETYAKRVKFLHEYLNGKRYPADRATKNASRLTRIPGCKRGNDQQYIVADGFGFPTWDAFESWVTAIKKLKDQRSQTSVQNGQKGGRPPMLAQDFASTIADRWRDSDGNLLVLFYKAMKQWYKYNPMQGWME